MFGWIGEGVFSEELMDGGGGRLSPRMDGPFQDGPDIKSFEGKAILIILVKVSVLR